MPNLYNRPVSSGFRNTYSSQFVPLPLEQFARTNELNQAKQDAEVAVLNNASDAAWKLSGVAKEDNDYINSIRNTFDNAAADLANKDLTQRENQDIARSLVRNIVRDKDLATIMSNKAKYDEYQKAKDEAIKAGTYQAYNDAFIPSYLNYSKNGGYKSGKGLDTTIYKYSEERPKIEEYFNNMREDGADSLGKIGDIYYKTGFEGVSKAKATNRAAQAFDSYLVTPEGQQGIRRYNYLKATNPSAVKGIKSGSEYVFHQFLDAGLERVHGKSTSGLAAAMNENNKKKEEETNLFAGLASNEIPSTLLDGLEVKFDSKGNIQGDGKGFFKSIGEDIKKGNYNPIDMWNNYSNNHDLTEEQNTRLKSVLVGSKLNGVSDEEYIKHFNKSWSPIIPQPLTGKAIKANNDAFYNGGAGLWSHMILSKDGKGSTGFIEALENEFGAVPDYRNSPKEFKEFLNDHGVQVTGAYAPNKLSARPIEITVGGSTFMADLTGGGKHMDNVSQADIIKHNLAKLKAGEQVEETDSDGNTVIHFQSMTKKDPKTGLPLMDYKIIPKKK